MYIKFFLKRNLNFQLLVFIMNKEALLPVIRYKRLEKADKYKKPFPAFPGRAGSSFCEFSW